MSGDDRIERWLADLEATLRNAADLAARGRAAYDTDPALPLAFEALLNRIGDLAKRLTVVDRDRFQDASWRAAARTRDFVVPHYDRVDVDVLWSTVTVSLPALAELVRAEQQPT